MTVSRLLGPSAKGTGLKIPKLSNDFCWNTFEMPRVSLGRMAITSSWRLTLLEHLLYVVGPSIRFLNLVNLSGDRLPVFVTLHVRCRVRSLQMHREHPLNFGVSLNSLGDLPLFKLGSDRR